MSMEESALGLPQISHKPFFVFSALGGALFQFQYQFGQIVRIFAVLEHQEIHEAPGLSFADAGEFLKNFGQFFYRVHPSILTY